MFFGDGAVTALFDFEKAEYVPPELELTRAIILSCLGGDLGTRDFALGRAFLSAYLGANPLPSERVIAALRAFFTKMKHSTWVLQEHYLCNNSRVNLFMDHEASLLLHDPVEVVERLLG